MIYQCDQELILSLSPEAMRFVAGAVDQELRGALKWGSRLEMELANFANELRTVARNTELDRPRTLCPTVRQSGNEDLL